MRKSSAKRISHLLALLALLLFSACGINSNLMFKIPKGESKSDTLTMTKKQYKLYEKDSVPLLAREDYRLAKDDKFTFTLSTNSGKRILEGLSGIGSDMSTSATAMQFEYTIRSDGFVTLPIVGDVNLSGKTVKQSEDTLVKLFSAHYLEPFVQLKVTNQRVIVFPGEGGEAKVILIKNNNTTLMEVLAEAGGIRDRGKANSIKLMRSVNGKREIYQIDLSTIEGIAYADMIVQANDYVYVEPNAKLGREALTQAAPFLALITTVLFTINIINNLK